MEKLKHQDKIKYVDKAVRMLKEDTSREEIDSYLMEEGLKNWDIKKINHLVDKQLKDQYKSSIKSYMIDDCLESKLSEFDDIDAGLFEKIQHEIIAEIQAESRRKVRSMISKNRREETIVRLVNNRFFDESAILAFIDQENERQTEKNNEQKKGLGFMVSGILLTIVSADVIPEGMVIFYGLIVYGFVILVKSH